MDTPNLPPSPRRKFLKGPPDRSSSHTNTASPSKMASTLRIREGPAPGRSQVQAPQRRAAAQRGSRPARLQVSTLRVHRVAPQRPGHARGGLSRVACTALWVWKEVVQRYAPRWLIEEFYKALKTRLGAEGLKQERAERIFAAVALMSMVGGHPVAGPAGVGASPPRGSGEARGPAAPEREVARGYTHQPLRTVGQVALGRLGGHQGCKGDGVPGWLTPYA